MNSPVRKEPVPASGTLQAQVAALIERAPKMKARRFAMDALPLLMELGNENTRLRAALERCWDHGQTGGEIRRIVEAAFATENILRNAPEGGNG